MLVNPTNILKPTFDKTGFTTFREIIDKNTDYNKFHENVETSANDVDFVKAHLRANKTSQKLFESKMEIDQKVTKEEALKTMQSTHKMDKYAGLVKVKKAKRKNNSEAGFADTFGSYSGGSGYLKLHTEESTASSAIRSPSVVNNQSDANVMTGGAESSNANNVTNPSNISSFNPSTSIISGGVSTTMNNNFTGVGRGSSNNLGGGKGGGGKLWMLGGGSIKAFWGVTDKYGLRPEVRESATLVGFDDKNILYGGISRSVMDDVFCLTLNESEYGFVFNCVLMKFALLLSIFRWCLEMG
jgi:hypothetical protein